MRRILLLSALTLLTASGVGALTTLARIDTTIPPRLLAEPPQAAGANDAIARLNAALDRGSLSLNYREPRGYLDDVLAGWGYHLIDLQLNDITFDQAITASMAQVVATANLKAAAINEGEALLIKKTKEAEAEGAAIRIAAEAEAEAARKRGEGVRLFRAEVAQGLAEASSQLRSAGVDDGLVWFAMWTETVRQAAEAGTGNVIFLDGSAEGMERTMRQMLAMGRNATGGDGES